MPDNKAKVKAKLAKQRLKEIRKFVDFDYDLRKPLTPYAQRKIKKYHDEISALTNRPYQVYRPRRADHRLQAQRFAQHETHLPGLKVAFIPTDGINPVRLKFGKSGVIAKTKHVQWEVIQLSQAGLLKDAAAEVEKRIRHRKESQFTINAGKYEIPQPYIKESLPGAVAQLVMKYGDEGGVDEDANHHWSHWLDSVKAYKFDKQAGVSEFLRDKAKSIKKGKLARLAAYKRRKRAEQRLRGIQWLVIDTETGQIVGRFRNESRARKRAKRLGGGPRYIVSQG